MTTFYRLLKDTDKASALRTAVTARRSGDIDPERTFTVDPTAFSKVPNTPFAYWVDDEIRDLFVKLPPFESAGRTVKQGLATADDFRFVRAWWEVDPARRLDPGLGGAPDWREDLEGFQAWCRRRTHEGKGWAPFAKGGEYSPYYSDIHLVVNWEREGEEIKNFVDPKTGKQNSRPQNTDYYFRPGVTWLRRTRRLTAAILPAGALFSDAAQIVFDIDERYSLRTLASMNSSLFDYLIRMVVGWSGSGEGGSIQFMGGMVASMPTILAVSNVSEDVKQHLRDLTLEKRLMSETGVLVSIVRKPLISSSSSEAYEMSAKWQAIDAEITALTLDNESDASIYERTAHSFIAPDEGNVALEYLVSVALAVDDLRLALNPDLVPALPDPFDPLPVVPPATLVGPDGLPATPGTIVSEEWLQARPNAITLPPTGTVTNPTITDDEYPIPIPWDGILVDDPDHPADIVARIRQVLTVLHGERAQQAEEELCAELAVDTLREYIANPKGFFADHLSRYSKSRRKAPIYWPLSTPSGGWTAWINYPRLTDATIYTLIDRYLRPRREVVQQLYEEMDRISAASRTRSQQRQCDEAARDKEELAAMEEDLKQIAAMPYRPNHDDGVPILASPFHRYFRHREWAKYLTGIRQSLEAGEYDWAHLAYAVWPERVREKARTDRSIAIAHGIEEVS